MTRISRFVATILAALALIVPVVAQEDKKMTSGALKPDSVLRMIYDEDQKNRNDVEADARRREQVRQLIRDGKVQSGKDYYYAAFIFQHGQKPGRLSLRSRACGHRGEQGTTRGDVA